MIAVPDVACAKTDCRWHKDGLCNAAQVFVDNGPSCSTYEPAGAQAPGPMGAAPQALRQALLARLAGGAPAPAPGPAPGLPVPRIGA